MTDHHDPGVPQWAQAARPGTPFPLYDPAPHPAPSMSYGPAPILHNPAMPPPMSPAPPVTAVATMGDRFLARLIDGLVLGVMSFAVMIIASTAGAAIAVGSVGADPTAGEPNPGVVLGAAITMAVIVVIPFVLYEVLCVGLAGATLGKKAMGIKVVDVHTGGRIGVGSAFVRYLVPLLGVVVIVGGLLVYLSPFWDRENRNRGWHDKAAGDIVVKPAR